MMQAVRTDEKGKTEWRDMGPSRVVRNPSSASLRAVAQMGDFFEDDMDEDSNEFGRIVPLLVFPDVIVT